MRGLLLVLTLHTLLLGGCANSQAQLPVQVPSGPLHVSLRELARTTGWTVVYESRAALDVRVPRITASAPEDAVEQMLRGTGLAYRLDEHNRAIFIREGKSPGPRPALLVSASSPWR